MTREDIIRWAKKAGVPQTHWGDLSLEYDIKVLTELSALAYAAGEKAERDRMTVNSIHTCHSECDRPGCVRVREAVKAEREACAKVCGDLADATKNHEYYSAYVRCEATIRARGET